MIPAAYVAGYFRRIAGTSPWIIGWVKTGKLYVDDFIEFAKSHLELRFLVTKIGCGIVGFREEQIAPLFAEAIDVKNIILPRDFVEIIQKL